MVYNDWVSDMLRRDDFKCPCGNCVYSRYPVVDIELVRLVSEIGWNYASEHLVGSPLEIRKLINISSANRCQEHNRSVMGNSRSMHLYGGAIDFSFGDISPGRLYDYLRESYPDRLGLGLYRGHVHIDVRNKPFRWVI